jgi:hypothetical protein
VVLGPSRRAYLMLEGARGERGDPTGRLQELGGGRRGEFWGDEAGMWPCPGTGMRASPADSNLSCAPGSGTGIRASI